MITAQPDRLVVTVVVTDLNGATAFGYTDPDGSSVCIVDSAVLDDDPTARAAAFEVFTAQAAVQAARTHDPRECAPRQRTAADRCASWPRRT